MASFRTTPMTSAGEPTDETGPGTESTTFYSVSIPSEKNESADGCPDANPTALDGGDDLYTSVESRVFVSRLEALSCLKALTKKLGKDKGPVRLKAFEDHQMALDFAAGLTPNPDTPPKDATSTQKNEEGTGEDGGTEKTDPSTSPPNAAATPIPPPSEGCPFKSLTPQQMKQIKEAIMKCDEESFRDLTESNPRYLVTPSDTPAICHSGTRANALHIAAQSGSVRMTNLVLEAVQDPALMTAMYPDESVENRVRRQEHIFDLYLNSQLKGNYNTPLHQASKIGAIDVVAALVQFSSCDTKIKNKFGMTPAEYAGEHLSDPQLSEQIKKLLGDHVYIPVFRVSDHSMPSFVGEPWSPRPLNNNSSSNGDNLDCSGDLAALSPVLIKHQLSTGTGVDWDKSPARGVSSPVNHHNLSTPRPAASSISSSPGGHDNLKPPRSPYILKTNGSKIMSVGLGGDHHQPVTSTESQLSESSLSVLALLGPLSPQEADQVKAEWKKPKNKEEAKIRLSDPVKGVERHGRFLAKRYGGSGKGGTSAGGGTHMIEYWDFLDTYVDLSTTVGLETLDEHLRQMSENNRTVEANARYADVAADESVVLSKEEAADDPFSVSQLLSGFDGLKLSEQTTLAPSDQTQQGDPLTEGDSNSLNDTDMEELGKENVQASDEQEVALGKLNTVEELKKTGGGDYLAKNVLSPNTLWNRPRISTNEVVASPGFGCEPETPFLTRHIRPDQQKSDPLTVGQRHLPVENLDNSVFMAPRVSSDSTHLKLSDDDDEDDCGSSFHTVASSLADSCLTAEEGQWIFMQGTVPTEADMQVYQIIQDTPVDKASYPYLAVWKDVMTTYSPAEQSVWPKMPSKPGNVQQQKRAVHFDAVTKKLFDD